jgi:uncharacterized protein (TIGR02996 family)
VNTLSVEEKWAKEGPDWEDATEVLAYSDWLEEQGRDAEAAGARWLKDKRPHRFPDEGVWGWKRGNDGHEGAVPLELLPARSNYLNTWHDRRTKAACYMAVIHELRKHPNKVNLLKDAK